MSISELANNMFKGSKPMSGKELYILKKTASKLISKTPTSLKTPYGYVIEVSYKYKITTHKFIFPKIIEETFVDLYWSHKIYKKLETAKEALNNIKKTSGDNYTFEIIPLYK